MTRKHPTSVVGIAVDSSNAKESARNLLFKGKSASNMHSLLKSQNAWYFKTPKGSLHFLKISQFLAGLKEENWYKLPLKLNITEELLPTEFTDDLIKLVA